MCPQPPTNGSSVKKANIPPKAKNDHPQPKVTTGTRVSTHGDGVKSAKPEKTVKVEKTAKTVKIEIEQTAKPQKTAKTVKIETQQTANPQKTEKTEKAEKTAKPQKTEKTQKTEMTAKTVKIETQQTAKPRKTEKTAKPQKTEKVAKTFVVESKSTTNAKGTSTKKPNATADSEYSTMETSYLKSRPVQATSTGEKSTNPTNSEYAFTSGKERKVKPTGAGASSNERDTSQGYGTMQPWATNQTRPTTTEKAERDVKRDRLIRTLRWFAYT